MLEIRARPEQSAFDEVERAAENGRPLKVRFRLAGDGEPFPGRTATNTSDRAWFGRMTRFRRRPGWRQGGWTQVVLEGVTFSEDYQNLELAGKDRRVRR